MKITDHSLTRDTCLAAQGMVFVCVCGGGGGVRGGDLAESLMTEEGGVGININLSPTRVLRYECECQ